jgi:hypothetical protein
MSCKFRGHLRNLGSRITKQNTLGENFARFYKRKVIASTVHAGGEPETPKLGDWEKSRLTCRCCDTRRVMMIGCKIKGKGKVMWEKGGKEITK